MQNGRGDAVGSPSAAIAGARPLVGPVLATQIGYLPGSSGWLGWFSQVRCRIHGAVCFYAS
ncbi:carbon starvation CstA family protein [Shigella flexneri]